MRCSPRRPIESMGSTYRANGDNLRVTGTWLLATGAQSTIARSDTNDRTTFVVAADRTNCRNR